MSTERDASAGASGRTRTHAPSRPRLKPPPRVVVARPPDARPAAGARGSAAKRSAAATRSATATWITVAFFGLLILAVIAVFVVLPDWVRARQASDQTEQMQAGRLRSQQENQQENQQEMADAPAAEPAPEIIAVPSPAAPPESLPPAPAAPRRTAPRPAAKPPGSGEFERAMSDGLAALDRGDYDAAQEDFSRAGGLRPGSPQSADGLARAERGTRLAKVRALRQQALDFERREDWHAAAKSYSAVLELDPAVQFAQDGHGRSQRRAELADRLDFHLANRQRLSSEEVLQEAAALVDQASEIDPAGPELARQIEGLAGAVTAFSTPVTATLESDQLTEIVVYRVGRLGTFSRHALDLRPGTYTVVGSRRGYRDVRRQLVIEPGTEPSPLQVRCEEKI